MSSIKLSILDQSPVRKGATAHQAIAETAELARLGDSLGYHRFWVSEHHNTTTLAGSTPEVLIAHLAGITKNIRLGSGGIMLPNHSALKVAENFRMLEILAPGRIDLGIGRAPGTDRLTASILNPSNSFSEQDLLVQLTDLRNYLNETPDPQTIQAKILAIPQALSAPPMWLLSSSGQSGLFAAHFGMGLSFAHFINPVGGPQFVKMYRDRFQPSAEFPEPAVNVG
ncbi:MAG: MsnO8 family LLM class oxidoreductase, partial [Sphingobacteriales bacterium]